MRRAEQVCVGFTKPGVYWFCIHNHLGVIILNHFMHLRVDTTNQCTPAGRVSWCSKTRRGACRQFESEISRNSPKTHSACPRRDLTGHGKHIADLNLIPSVRHFHSTHTTCLYKGLTKRLLVLLLPILPLLLPQRFPHSHLRDTFTQRTRR